jgi:ABC-type branched-subunit amino acid transport system permease subunit
VQWYAIVIGLALVAIVLFMPRGLLGIRDALRPRASRRAA